MNLKDLRRRIDQVDRKLLGLLNRRASLALQVGRIKKKRGLQIFDRKREEAVIRRLTQDNHGPLPRESIRRIFREILRHSRKMEKGVKSDIL